MTEPTNKSIVAIDIDGVMADTRHRLKYITQKPKKWNAFFNAAVHDKLHAEGKAMYDQLRIEHEIIFLTGRPEKCRADTEKWLEKNSLVHHKALIMRPPGDFRPAAVVKAEQLTKYAAGRTVALVIDDDPDVIQSHKDAGRPTHLAMWEPRGKAISIAQEKDGKV